MSTSTESSSRGVCAMKQIQIKQQLRPDPRLHSFSSSSISSYQSRHCSTPHRTAGNWSPPPRHYPLTVKRFNYENWMELKHKINKVLMVIIHFPSRAHTIQFGGGRITKKYILFSATHSIIHPPPLLIPGDWMRWEGRGRGRGDSNWKGISFHFI